MPRGRRAQRRRAQRRIPLIDRVKDGRIFQKSGESDGGRTIYLRCQKRTICKGTAKLINGEIHDLCPHSENCYPDPDVEHVARFKNALIESLSTHWYKLSTLYDSLALVHHEAAAVLPYRRIKSFMKRCRKNHYPPSPQNIAEFGQRLSDPTFSRNLEYESGRLSSRMITDRNGAQHVIIYDADFVRTKMRETSKLLIDATFKSRPGLQDAYQLLTVMGIKLNHGFPFAWVVMSSKSEAAYEAVLQCLKRYVIPNNEILLAMSDFERGLRNAINRVFLTALSTGCNTHYDRAVYGKAKELGLQNLIRNDDDARRFFKKILALAYLPANLIEAQYRVLVDSLPARIKPRFAPLCQYYRRYWLGIVKPRGFSVYGLGRRTNNIIESYHSRLGHRMENRPGPWDFICKLLKLQSDVRVDINHLENNRQIGRHARYSTIWKQRELLMAWRELHMLEITVEEFMEKAASLKGNVAAIMAQQIEARVGNAYELDETPAGVNVPLERDPDYEAELFVDQPPDWLIDNARTAPVAEVNDSSDDQSDDDSSQSSIGSDTEEDEVEDARGDNSLDAEGRSILTPPLVELREHRDYVESSAEDDEVPPTVEDIRRPILSPSIQSSDNSSEDDERPPPAPTPPPRTPTFEEMLLEFDRGYSPLRDWEDDDDPLPNPTGGIAENAIDSAQNEHAVDEVARSIPGTENQGGTDPLPAVASTSGETRQQAPSNNNRVGPRQKRKRRRSASQANTPQLEPATEKKKKRNKRRKEMRRKVRAKKQNAAAAQRRSEEDRLSGELVEAQNRLRMANQRLAEIDTADSCRVCLSAPATHCFWPCGHRCCCLTCAARVWVQTRACPLCNQRGSEGPRRIWLPFE